jgi:hypothetical protein
MSTATLDSFKAECDAKNTVYLKVLEHCYTLIERLREHWKLQSLAFHKQYIDEYGDVKGYHQEQIDRLNNNDLSIDYEIKTGKKYHKIVLISYGSPSVHCFVDKESGEVFKAASWNAPAKKARYNLKLIAHREYLFKNADWSGSYLYLR